MADRYWVGGTGTWDGTAGTKWATTSGGTGGASVPTSADNVFFDAASGTVTVTVSVSPTIIALNLSGFTGTLTGASSTITLSGSFTMGAAASFTANILQFTAGTQTLTSNGKTLNCAVTLASTSNVTLADALVINSVLTVSAGTFNTSNYAVSVTSFAANSSNTRQINLGSSTVAVSSNISFGTTATGLTFNAGTSTINLSSASASIIMPTGFSFYNVAFTNTGITTASISGANTFNNLSVAGRTTAGISAVSLAADQTINGTLTLSAGTNATMRTFVRSNTIGTTRTLTCAAVASLTDIDFRDITIAGAAAPASGTRFGDCKGNSGITFDAAKTVYYIGIGGGNWGSTGGWSLTSGGAADPTAVPLAQDTAVIDNAKLTSGSTITVNAAYNIGTIDMSARTSNTMTLATGTNTPTIYGNWINGTGTTLTGTGNMTFAGRGSQTITSSGKTFTQAFTINTPGGSVVLQDAFVSSSAIALTAGTLDSGSYNITLGLNLSSSGSLTRSLSLGSSAVTIQTGGSTAWSIASATNLTITGTGTISLTSASAKTFAGGGIQTYPTLNQGGAGALTITGSNKFANITNTYAATGATSVLFTAGTTNEFTNFNLTGQATRVCTLGSTTTSQAILKKPTAWNMGANSTDGGNNTGLTFTAGGGIDYLSVSYINGQVTTPAPTATGNFLFFFN